MGTLLFLWTCGNIIYIVNVNVIRLMVNIKIVFFFIIMASKHVLKCLSIEEKYMAFVSLYSVYCWKIIQRRMFVVDNFHVKIRYTYTHFFHMFLQVLLVSGYLIV